MVTQEKSLYTLIPLDDFKAVLGIDDREDRLARFCLVTSTLTVEQYCKRKFLRKKYFETVEFCGDLVIPLREYPVSEILAAFLLMRNEEVGIRKFENPPPCGFSTGSFFCKKTPAKAVDTAASMPLEPEFYRAMIGCEFNEDLPFCLLLSPSVKRFSRLLGVKVIYWGGYKNGSVPADLASACLELASWNMNRYRGRRVGMTGNIRGAGKEGEHFEMSMPENVKQLLEPYRRKTI